MSKKKRLIPFSFLPASWGLSGKTRKIAEAEYNFDGDDLQYELLRIESKTEKDFQLKKLSYDLEQSKITEFEYNREKAGINNEPWVDVKKIDINTEDPKAGYMELDWNDEFVQMLQGNGYTGKSDEDVVNKWFNDVCRTVLLAEAQDMDFGLQDSTPEVIRVKDDDTDDSRD